MKKVEQKEQGSPLSHHLFAIDVEAEVRKLGRDRLKSRGEAALDLVRFVAGLAPDSVEISLFRKRLCVRSRGGIFDEPIALALMDILNDGRSPEARHEAVVQLEKMGGLPLLGAFSSPDARVRIEWSSNRKLRGLYFRPGARARKYTPKSYVDFQIEVRGRRQNIRAERALIKTQCRFSSRPITLGSKRVDGGIHLRSCLLERNIEVSGVRGLIGVPIKGDLVNVVTIENGIVKRQFVRSVPGGFVLDAVVEGIDLHERRLLGVLKDCALNLYLELKTNFHTLGARDRARAKKLLLEHCILEGDASFVFGIPLFRDIKGHIWDFEGIEKWAGEHRVHGIHEKEAFYSEDVDSDTVLVLTDSERRFLETFLDTRVTRPPPKTKQRSFRLGSLAKTRAVVAHLKKYWPKSSGQPVAKENLSSLETQFLDALKRDLIDIRPMHRILLTTGQPSLVVPRRNNGKTTLHVSANHPRFQQTLHKFKTLPEISHPFVWLLID